MSVVAGRRWRSTIRQELRLEIQCRQFARRRARDTGAGRERGDVKKEIVRRETQTRKEPIKSWDELLRSSKRSSPEFKRKRSGNAPLTTRPFGEFREELRKAFTEWAKEHGSPAEIQQDHDGEEDESDRLPGHVSTRAAEGIDSYLTGQAALYPQPGTLMDFGISQSDLGIILSYDRTDGRYLVVRSDGVFSWWIACLTPGTFAVNNFTSTSVLRSIATFMRANKRQETDEEAEETYNLDLDNPTVKSLVSRELQRVAEFVAQADTFFRAHCTQMDKNAKSLADARKELTMRPSEVLRRLIPGLPSTVYEAPSTQYALNTWTRSGLHPIRPSPSFRQDGKYLVRSLQASADLDQAKQWIREYFDTKDPTDREYTEDFVSDDQILQSSRSKNPVEGFISKCRDLIIRQREADTGASSASEPTGDQFTRQEQILIHLVDAYARSKLVFSTAERTLTMWLIRATGLYPEIVNKRKGSTSDTFLSEIGVRPKNLEPELYGTRIKIWSFDGTAPHLGRYRGDSQSPTEIAASLGLQDSMADLRLDMRWLCMCSLDTQETRDLDDAWHVQVVPELPGYKFVRLFYADVGSVLPRDHEFAINAQDQGRTFYHPLRRHPLLPPALTTNVTALGGRRSQGGRNAVCVNILLDPRGHVADTEITLVKTQHVVPLLKSGERAIPNSKVIPDRKLVGQYIDGIHLGDLNFYNAQSLHAASAVATVREQKRIDSGFLLTDIKLQGSISLDYCDAFDETGARVRQMPDRLTLPPPGEITRIESRPLPRPSFQPSEHWDERGQGPTRHYLAIIRELSYLGIEAVGLWVKARSVPALCVTRVPRGDMPKEYRDSLKRIISSHADAGRVPLPIASMHNLQFQVKWGSRPAPDPLNGLEAYVKIGSPMREYAELFNQWQVLDALRWEAQNGIRDQHGRVDGGLLRSLIARQPGQKQQREQGESAVRRPGKDAHRAVKPIPSSAFRIAHREIETDVIPPLNNTLHSSYVTERNITLKWQYRAIQTLVDERQALDALHPPPAEALLPSWKTGFPIPQPGKGQLTAQTLPRTFRFWVNRAGRTTRDEVKAPVLENRFFPFAVYGSAKGLEVPRSLILLDKAADLYKFRVGDWWEVEIDKVDMKNLFVFFRPAGEVSGDLEDGTRRLEGLGVNDQTGRPNACLQRAEKELGVVSGFGKGMPKTQESMGADWDVVRWYDQGMRGPRPGTSQAVQ